MGIEGLGLNVNITILAAMVGIIEFIKRIDQHDRIKFLYPWFQLILSVVVAVLVTESLVNFWAIGLNAFIYFGISTLFYRYILKKINEVIEIGNKKAQKKE